MAATAALAEVPADVVERLYSSGLYPSIQRALTSISNLVPFALFDALLVGLAIVWVGLLIHDLRARRGGLLRAMGSIAWRTVVMAAVCYLAFLATWGLNYRRVALADKLEFDAGRVSPEAAEALAIKAVAEVNRLYSPAGRTDLNIAAVDPSLPEAFGRAQRELGAEWNALLARPKRSLLDLYFRRASVDGMTDPYFLETLVVSDLLPFERSFVVAHEWSHLAGFADEAEANFLGWLTCLHGSKAAQYSGWLFLYGQSISAVPSEHRRAIIDKLENGPREDLRAISDRIRRQASPLVSAAGWRMYDRYLKANRVETGAASYAEVVRLVLGASFSSAGVPELRRPPAAPPSGVGTETGSPR
jgi:hypothetical protein